MTTAMETWGEAANRDDDQGADVHQRDDGDEEEFVELDGAERESAAGDAGAEAGEVTAQDDEAALKKKKREKLMFMGAAAAVAVTVVGFKLMSALGSVAPAEDAQMAQAQVAEAPATGAQAVAPLPPLAPQMPAAQQMPQFVPQSPAVAQMPVAPMAPVQATQVAPIAPVVPGSPVGGQPAAEEYAAPAALMQTMMEGMKAAEPAQMKVDAAAAAVLREELDAVRADVASLRTLLASRDASIEDMRRQLSRASRAPKPTTQAAPKTPAAAASEKQSSPSAVAASTKPDVKAAKAPEEKLVVVDPQVVEAIRQTPASPAPQGKGGKVRGDFSVYAVSNGRAWLTWSKDGQQYMVGVASQLPDYSKVTRIDDETGVIFTSGGEVHPKPATH